MYNFTRNCAEFEINRRNGLFVLPISSHMTILLGSFSIILLFAFIAYIFMARNMVTKSKDFSQEIDDMAFKRVRTTSNTIKNPKLNCPHTIPCNTVETIRTFTPLSNKAFRYTFYAERWLRSGIRVCS